MYIQLDADKVRATRRERGWSRRALAARAGVGLSTVAAVERGEHPVQANTARRVVEALGVPREDVGRPSHKPRAREEESMSKDWLEEAKRYRFPDVLDEYMDARGIEDLEELHRLYLEAGGEFDLATFGRHARGEAGVLTPEFISPLFDALGLAPPVPPEGNALMLAYGLAYRRLPEER